MSYRLEFEIGFLPKMPNQLLRGHWRNAHNNKVLWHSRVMRAIGRNIPAHPIKRAHVTLVRFSSVVPDFDGLVGSFKPCLDACVKCGVLEDDAETHIGQPTYRHEKVSPGKGKIKIIVEEICG